MHPQSKYTYQPTAEENVKPAKKLKAKIIKEEVPVLDETTVIKEESPITVEQVKENVKPAK
jgi:hypothetical protein